MRDPGRESLRRVLLDRRDSTSHEMLKIASGNIRNILYRSDVFDHIHKVGAYHTIGSEIMTGGIIQDLLDSGREIFLPAVRQNTIQFKAVRDTNDLVPGVFGIMEPRDKCATGIPEALLVPAVGATLSGIRLGYGHGYYDRYIRQYGPVTICVTMNKQIVKKIPPNPNDTIMDWISTESRLHKV